MSVYLSIYLSVYVHIVEIVLLFRGGEMFSSRLSSQLSRPYVGRLSSPFAEFGPDVSVLGCV